MSKDENQNKIKTIIVDEREMNVEELNAAKYNPRKISGQQLKSLRASIKENGILEPLIVNKRTGMTVVSGHQRLRVAKELEMKTVPVKLIDVDENKEKVLNLALNKIGGAFDTPKLENVIRDVFEFSSDIIEQTGFAQQEVEKMLAEPDVEIEGEYPITPYFSEKYNYAIIMTKNEIDWSFLQNALELRQEQSYKSSAIGLGHVVDFERFRELWLKNKN